jgi:hypothetical protein
LSGAFDGYDHLVDKKPRWKPYQNQFFIRFWTLPE